MTDSSTIKSYKKFLVIWMGELISSIGSGITAFGLSVYMFQTTGTATSVGIVTLCAFLPSVMLAPFAGALADRMDRRLLMVLGDSLSAVGLVVLLILLFIGDPPAWQIYLCVGINSIFVSLLAPTYKATITDLVEEKDFTKASGMVQLADSSKYLLSPIIAGIILSFTDIKLILIIDICTIFITVITIMAVRKNLPKFTLKSHGEKTKISHDIRDGFMAILESKGVMTLVLIMSLVTFYVGFLQTLFKPMLLVVTDETTLGMIESIGAIGMLVTSLVIGVVTLKRRYVSKIFMSMISAGVFVMLLGVCQSKWLIAGFGFMFFASLPLINTGTDFLIRRTVPNEKQGRVWGIISVISQMGYIVAYCVAGVLADYVFNPLLKEGGVLAGSLGQVFGVGEGRGIGLLFAISGALMILTALLIISSKSVRRLDVE
ncbi:MAG TPA: MFS transporter [Ruminococcaceae bacterium]|nr:MFS transporter [Oscillospiraceae bacterium]